MNGEEERRRMDLVMGPWTSPRSFAGAQTVRSFTWTQGSPYPL